MLWEDLREEEFKEAIDKSRGVCVLPVGCLEKHGKHLPVGTDAIYVGELCKRAAEAEPVVVFPTMYFGEKTGAGEFKGTVMFSARLRFDILTETCAEIGRNGFSKILIVSGHGGNAAMIDNFARSVLEQKRDYMVFSVYHGMNNASPDKILSHDYDYLTTDDKKILQDFTDEGKMCGHGCFIETARNYAVRPDLVRIDKMNAESGESSHLFDEFARHGVKTPFSWMGNYPNSYQGSYHEGLNERIARAVLEHSVDEMAKVFGFLKNETVSRAFHASWCEKQSF